MEIQQLIKEGLLIPQEDGTYKIETELRKRLIADGVLLRLFEDTVNYNTDYKLKEIQTDAENEPSDNRKSFYKAESDKLLRSCNSSPWNKTYKSAQGNIDTYLSMVLSSESFDDSTIKSFIDQERWIFHMGNPFKFYLDKKYLLALEELISEEPVVTTTKIRARDKIKWLAGCAELGELFVQLERMGWIEEIKPNIVDKLFYVDGTSPEAASIKDYLRPGMTGKSPEKPYPKIYSPRYKAQFENLKKRSD